MIGGSTFDVRVAIIGNQKSGMSTVLNTLLGDKYGDLAKCRTRNAAGVNHFCLTTNKSSGGNNNNEGNYSTRSGVSQATGVVGNISGRPSPYEEDNGDQISEGYETMKSNHTAVEGTMRNGHSIYITAHESFDATSTTSNDSSLSDTLLSGGWTLTEELYNGKARGKNGKSKKVQTFEPERTIDEQSFHIELDQPLCEMRDDANLVLVDIPGIFGVSEDKTSSVPKRSLGAGAYREYTSDKWDTFDCVIAVLDVSRGEERAEEQIKLLEFIQTCRAEKKQLPVIIVANKVDDPEEDHQRHLVDSLFSMVKFVFDDVIVQCEMEKMLNKGKERFKDAGGNKFTAFLPISALKAFLYRTTARLTLDQFRQLDEDVIEILGHDEVGSYKFNRLPESERVLTAYAAVSNPFEVQDRAKATNHTMLRQVLDFCIGGSETQLEVISQQLIAQLRRIPADSCIADQLREVHHKRKILGIVTEDLHQEFWRMYKPVRKAAVSNFVKKVDPQSLARASNEVVQYGKLAVQLEWRGEVRKAFLELESLVRQQLRSIIESQCTWSFDGWFRTVCPLVADAFSPACAERVRSRRTCDATLARSLETPTGWVQPKRIAWGNLSPRDWGTILSSISLLASDHCFYEAFGQEKVILDRILLYYNSQTVAIASVEQRDKRILHMQAALQGSYVEGQFVPRDQAGYETCVRFQMPRSLSNPNHFGHVAWQYCSFRRELQRLDRLT